MEGRVYCALLLSKKLWMEHMSWSMRLEKLLLAKLLLV